MRANAPLSRNTCGKRACVTTEIRRLHELLASESPARPLPHHQQKRRQWRRPEVSLHPPQPHERFDMKGLWEQVEKIDGGNFVPMLRFGKFRWLARCLQENRQVSSQRGRIARKVSYLARSEFGKLVRGGLPQACARRVENDEIRLFGSFLQVFLGVRTLCNYSEAGFLRVFSQIAGGGQVGVYAYNALELLG